MRPKATSWVIRAGMIGGGILVVSCSLLIYKERETLSRLVNPGQNFQTTEIFSRWLDVKGDETLSWERVHRWLSRLDYLSVPHVPDKPGEFQADFPKLIVFMRSFRYPDADYPAQLLELHFSKVGLKSLTSLAGRAPLETWRLEPVRLAEWSAGNKTARVRVRISELPPYVSRAVIAIEDKRFFEHGAFDPIGIARALWIDLRHGQLRQGASTISQQLARSIFLNIDRTWRRKMLEAALAFYLEVRYSKPQLLEMYLNQVYWGQDGSESLLGIEAVSQSLFGKPARALTVAESAVLAGMLQSPNRYSPRARAGVSDDRKKIVLSLMKDQKVITEEQYQAALKEKIPLSKPKKSNDAAYVLANLRDGMSERYNLSVMLSQGWKIYTTLDPLLQREAVQSLPPFKREGPQAALVALDPRSGAIRAWLGGTQFATSPFDRAGDAKRQPGSAFKPFVVLAALEGRKATTATLIEDKPLTLKGMDSDWKPQNYDRNFRGNVSVWDSLVYSYNIPIVKLAMQTTLRSVMEVATRVGIVSPMRDDLSLSLGSSEVTLSELTGAYATLANAGIRNYPYGIEMIVDHTGRILEAHESQAQPVITPELAFLVTRILEAVINEGTGKVARLWGFTSPAAGKTGTSENFQDAWFVGYTSELVCGVWVGYDFPKSLGRSAAGIAVPIWAQFMKKAVAIDPPKAFAEPQGLVWKTIDPESGLSVRTGCPKRRKEAFLAGTEPVADCPLHAGGLIGIFKRLRH